MKDKRFMKKFFCLILSLAMIVSPLSVSAAGDGNSGEPIILQTVPLQTKMVMEKLMAGHTGMEQPHPQDHKQERMD